MILMQNDDVQLRHTREHYESLFFGDGEIGASMLSFKRCPEGASSGGVLVYSNLSHSRTTRPRW